MLLVEKKRRVLFNIHINIVVQILGEHFARCGTIVNLKFSILQVDHVFKFVLPYRVVQILELLQLLASNPDFVVRLQQLHLLLVEVRDFNNQVIQICLCNLTPFRGQARESKCRRQIPILCFDVLVSELILCDDFEGSLHKTTCKECLPVSHIPQHIIVLNHAVPQLKMFVDTPALFFQLGIFNFFVVKVNPGPFVLKITNNTTFSDPCHVGVVFSVDFFF